MNFYAVNIIAKIEKITKKWTNRIGDVTSLLDADKSTGHKYSKHIYDFHHKIKLSLICSTN